MIEISSWVVADFFISFMLIILLVFRNSSARLKMGKMYSKILSCTLFLVLMDVIARLGDSDHLNIAPLVHIGIFFMYILDPIVFNFTLGYVDFWMDDKKLKKRKVFQLFFASLAIVNAIIVIIDYLFGMHWLFILNGSEYSRGSYYMCRAYILFAFIVLVMVYVIIFRKNIMAEYRNMILVLPILSIIGALIQAFTSIKTTYAALAMACITLYFIYQTTDVNVDYLTGVYNRRGLDWKLYEKIKTTASGKTFSVVMLDIDHFKEINDSHGHDEGDYAIKATAEILVDVFDDNDIIGRFGGDEFCIISDLTDTAVIEEKITDVRNRLKKIRQKRGWTDLIDISSGVKIYDSHKDMTRDEFMKPVDELMYKEKEAHHEGTK